MAEVSSEGETPQSFSDLPASAWDSSSTNASEVAPASESTGTTEASPTPPASATTSPESSSAPAVRPRESAAIPVDRHEAVLQQERQRREAVEAKWNRVAWADELVQRGATAEDVQSALAMRGNARNNPIGFIEQLLSEAANRPDLLSQVRSIAGRLLGTNGQQANGNGQATEEAEPQPDFQQADGTPFYSAPQLKKWQEWNSRKQKAEFDKRIAPFEQERTQRAEQAQAEETRQQYLSEARESRDRLAADPMFREHYEDVKAYIRENGYTPTFEHAFLLVMRTKVLPTMTQTGRATAIAELRTQAQSSSVNPKAGAASVPASVNSFSDPRLKWT